MIEFENSSAIVLAATVVAFTIAIVRARRRAIRMPPSRLFAGFIGTALIVMAAGSPRLRWAMPVNVVVMVDCSPSTRTATFRNADALAARVSTLVPNTSDVHVQVRRFAEHPTPPEPFFARRGPLAAKTFEDLPAKRTVFPPPSADAVLLFSDGQFELPKNVPPIFAVIDSSLDTIDDAAITQLDYRPGEPFALLSARSSQSRRSIVVSINQQLVHHVEVGPGNVSEQIAVNQTSNASIEMSATIKSGDRWPENDSLSFRSPTQASMIWYWIGEDRAPDPWVSVERAAQLPHDLSAFAQISAFVLDNQSIDSLTNEMQNQLRRYVRDLGGTLIIGGGEHAFAAGGYVGTSIDSLSPLASSPPRPRTRWIVLLDSSGSMAASLAPGETKWSRATSSARNAIAHLPVHDVIRIGSFANELRWWMNDSPLDSVDPTRLAPPAGVAPNGPTNLRGALQRIASDPSAMPTNVLVITDADADVAPTADLAHALVEHSTRLFVLATQHISSSSKSLQTLAESTGGSFVVEAEPSQWPNAFERLGRAAIPDAMQNDSTVIHFNDLLHAPSRMLSQTNHVWMKPGATSIATRSDNSPIAAEQQVGLGRVISVGFRATQQELSSIAMQYAQPASDPRFHISWQTAIPLRVRIEADEPLPAMAQHQVTLQLLSSDPVATSTTQIPQTAPGRYELDASSSVSSRVASILVDGCVVSRIALPGRYAQEFDRLGNDHDALRELCAQSGGKVIDANDQSPIQLPHRFETRSITSIVATLGAVCIGFALWQAMRDHAVRSVI